MIGGCRLHRIVPAGDPGHRRIRRHARHPVWHRCLGY